ncbi:MAG: hypothetical protein WCI73_14200 [Phycisphaerae bacterium]
MVINNDPNYEVMHGNGDFRAEWTICLGDNEFWGHLSSTDNRIESYKDWAKELLEQYDDGLDKSQKLSESNWGGVA